MTDYIRRLVSGNKARFKDSNLNLELDLVYVTDQIIIMGYPAIGIEGLYRNRREDAKKFLEHRHGKNYWVYNFCPIRENSYDVSVFDGRVSRYPFPDHHAPPLAILPLVARDMRAWLSGSPERVAVLHCKAGKGRSGTMACAYLLSLDDEPTPPRLERSYSKREWAKVRAENAMEALPDDLHDNRNDAGAKHSLSPVFETTKPDSDTQGILDAQETGYPPGDIPSLMARGGSSPNHGMSFTNSLKGVLDLHTARRMKSPSEGKKAKQGVSIPSQRRWLNYWALILAHEAPSHLWVSKPSPFASKSENSGSSPSSELTCSVDVVVRSLALKPRVRLTEIKLRMRETSGVKKGIIKAANVVIDRAKDGKLHVGTNKNGNSANHIWASLARYDDDLVRTLEQWEEHTRDEQGRMGHRRKGSERIKLGEEQEQDLSKIFSGEKWDKGKMVRSFARLGEDGLHEEHTEGGDVIAYILHPLSDRRWENIQDHTDKTSAQTSEREKNHVDVEAMDIPKSENNSAYDVTSGSMAKREREHQLKRGILLDAGREVRVKLYMGQVFMCWLWFIPTFHMPQPSHLASRSLEKTLTSTSLLLSRKDLDFPVGIGGDIINVEIRMEWVTADDIKSSAEPVLELEPPARATTGDTLDKAGTSGGVAAAVQAVVGGAKEEGSGGLREAVEAKQGEEET